MEAGGQKGKLSCTTTGGQLQEKLPLQIQVGKDVYCPSYKKSTTLATQLMRNPPYPELSLFSNGLSFRTTPLNFLLSLYKITFLFFFVGLAYSFCRGLLVLNYNSLLFSNRLIFAGKITFIFQFNITILHVAFEKLGVFSLSTQYQITK